jgi:DNA-binding response OmpR family regulator
MYGSSVILRLQPLADLSGESQMKILSISLDLELLQLRRAALEAAGHEVVIVDSEKEALQTVQAPESFGAVLLCHRFPDAIARQTVRLVRQSHPDTRVIYISHLYGEWPEVEADRYIVGADGPEALVRVLQEVHA